MVKVTVLYGEPQDPAAFEEYYLERHIPEFGVKIPGLITADISKSVKTGEEKPPYYRIADLWFKDMAVMTQALGSPEGKAAVADVGTFATGGYKVLVSETTTVEVAAAAV